MTDSVNLREAALASVTEILEKDGYSHHIMNQILGNYQYLPKQERAFLTRLSEGTVEQKIHLDYIINQFSKVKVNKMKPVIRNLLRLGVYQIVFMDSVPDSAACNEAVKLAGKKGFAGLKGFVNGVLRSIIRNRENIAYPCRDSEPVLYLSIRYSTPEWIIKDWLNHYSFHTIEQILQASLIGKDTSIRSNQNKCSTSELKELLLKEGIKVSEGAYLDYALRISEYDSFQRMSEFRQGMFMIQDESSMLAVEAAGIKKGDYVIDVCAAPGGKSILAAEKAGVKGKVLARDLTESKITYIEDNRRRAGADNLEPEVMDARILDENSIQKADVVLADLPCSGLGVIGKKADIKYKMTKEKQDSLVKLQKEILTVVQNYVKPDGTLIYSTCTINHDENLSVVRWFTEHFPFVLDSLNESLPEKLHCQSTKDGYLQLLPGIHETDGFFIARLKRKI